MCGRPVYKPRYYKVEGVIMILCDKCAKYGQPIDKRELRRMRTVATKVKKKVDRILEDTGWDLVENFGLKIRDARIKLGLKQEELAMKIGEPVSFIRKLESGKIRPPDNVIDKLEKILGIRIRKQITDEDAVDFEELKLPKSKSRITLGDVVVIKKKKKKKKEE